MAGHHHAGKGGATRLTTPQARESKDYAHVIGLFAEMAALPEDAPERERLRVHIIESCLPIAENIATRYRGRGQSHEDLVQVASVGLVNAVNRFDLDKGRDFLSFAIPTMMGRSASTSAIGGGTFGFHARCRKIISHCRKRGCPHPKSRPRANRSRARCADRRRTR